MGGIDLAAREAAESAAAGSRGEKYKSGYPDVQTDSAVVRAAKKVGNDQLGKREAGEAAAAGFRGVKYKVGYPDGQTDIAVVRAAQKAGNDLLVRVDYNQSLDVPEAVRRGRLLDGEGIGWIEEPTAADDFAGHAQIAREVRTPIQLGENWWGTHDMAKSLAAGASDYVMVDLMKIGGISGWLRAAALAEPSGVRLSSHLFPEVSAHLMAA